MFHDLLDLYYPTPIFVSWSEDRILIKIKSHNGNELLTIPDRIIKTMKMYEGKIETNNNIQVIYLSRDKGPAKN